MNEIGIKFFKKAYSTEADAISDSIANKGSIIYDDTTKSVYIYGTKFGSNVSDVTVTDGIVTVTKQDGSTFTINVGDLTALTTTAKDDLVSAINEIDSFVPADTTATDNQLTNKLYVDTQLSKVSTEHTVFVRNMTDSTASISPNIFYIWGEVTELDITLADPADTTIYNEYMFQFTSGDVATTLSLPDGITWYLGNDTVVANKTYQVSIVNKLAVLGEF